jgi:hypothetical protein
MIGVWSFGIDTCEWSRGQAFENLLDADDDVFEVRVCDMSKGTTKQARRFHEPLVDGDTEAQTLGCRHTNPNICAKNAMPSVCAYVRADGMCTSPPASWLKQFIKLSLPP